jgi:hypothetical protein
MAHLRSPLPAVIAVVFVLGPFACPTGPARAQSADVPPSPHTDREPLAFTLGAAPRPPDTRPPEARARSWPADDLLLRVPSDETIAALIDSTSADNMMATIQRLQDFVSRYVVVDSCWAAGYWIRDEFASLGYADIRTDTFRTWTFQDSVSAVNVVAVKPGTTRPTEYVILGGHYDSVTNENFTDPDAPAPGAEDNATGTAAVLEAARVLRDVGLDRSVIFACWSAEEVGLWGSRAFVADAVEESLDIVLYLNVDCIGVETAEAPFATVYSDSQALAVGAFIADVARTYTAHPFDTTVQPIGSSDQNSFWEAGYNVVDTDPNGHNLYLHTPNDIIDHVDPDLLWSIAATNLVATAAVAGVVGEDPNLLPETTLVENCAATRETLTLSPTFEWDGVDFDGEVVGYEYTVEQPDGATRREDSGGAGRSWTPLPAGQRSITLEGLSEDTYRFLVRAVDDDGARDPSPTGHTFEARLLYPTITVETNFLPETRVFVERWTEEDDVPVSVFENELLVFEISTDASSYCGVSDSAAVAVNDSTAWAALEETPRKFVLRPALGDTAVYFLASDENGATTVGRIVLAPVAAPMSSDLLRVDDWLDSAVDDELHDAFYDSILSDREHDVWDPLEHIEGGFPTLPPMEELGRYRTIIWTLDRNGGFLRAAQAESAYHNIEGYVRAGGNLILEGQSSLATLGGSGPFDYSPRYVPGEFVYDYVGVDSLRNAGANQNPASPSTYGYAFLGGLSVGPPAFVDVPVDTVVKWGDEYEELGGIPYCETVRPLGTTARLYLFDAYLNDTLHEMPCATARFPTDGTGTLAWFGFPFYYLETPQATTMIGTVLASLDEWQASADLVFFDWEATPRSVEFSWYLDPPDDPKGCRIERREGVAGSTDAWERLNDELLVAGPNGRYDFVDEAVAAATVYSYRLAVVERWGGTTLRGPWDVDVPPCPPGGGLSLPHPNPFRDLVELAYSVGTDEQWVAVGIYDVAGRRVALLEETGADAGTYFLEWDGTNSSGERVASGIYFVRARIGDQGFQRKVVFLK